MTARRRLAAILVADVVGYSKLIGTDEAGTLAQLQSLRTEVIEPQISKQTGRLFKAVGDGFLIEFASAVQAVICAKAIQDANAGGLLPLRIGIHVGDVVVQGDDLLGDGVNVAARIEGVAEPGGIAISRQVRDQVRDKLDVALIDKGEIELKNIVRPVRVFLVAGSKAALQAQPLALPDKPSIAVLPFQNMSGDPEQEYFADGIVEDIITALSRFKSLFVIARNSSFTYKGKAVDIKQVGRELGVRYVLEGSVRKAGGRVRITGQLIEATSGAHLWADRFDGALEDIFDLQDQVTGSVVGAVVPSLDQAEIERTQRKQATNLEAYDYFLRGLAIMHTSNKEALALFRRTVELDPNFATAYGLAARCYLYRQYLSASRDAAFEQAETRRMALRASELGQGDALALTWAGQAFFEVCREFEIGEALVDQALSINPNLAVGWTNRGLISMYLGHHQLAIDQVRQALRLSPRDFEAYRAQFTIAANYLFLGKYAEAVSWARQSAANRPGIGNLIFMSATALAGNTQEARVMLGEVLRMMPTMNISRFRRNFPFRKPEDAEPFYEGLRLAGLPE